MKADNNIQQVASYALATIDEDLVSLELIETGSTSSAFMAMGASGTYALRVPTPTARKSANYDIDYFVRAELSRVSDRIAKPLHTNLTANANEFGEWALDEFCAGKSPERAKIPREIACQLGVVLRHLHSLDVEGYGLISKSGPVLRGSSNTKKSGILSRFESPWPLGEDTLTAVPAVLLKPPLRDALIEIQNDLGAFLDGGDCAVIHSDLHEKQLLVHDNQLIALLDFNEVVALRPEWDLGSVLYFHGETCLEHVLEGYAPEANRSVLADAARLAAILIALHHGNRGVILGRQHRIEASTKFLSAQLL